MKLVITILSFFIATTLFGQHSALQSHYMFNGIAMNPALTGSEEAFSIIGSFRAQWTGIKGAPKTESLTAHAPLRKYNSSLGAQIYADQIGVDNNTGVFASYAYRLSFKKSKLSLGISGGLNFIQQKFSELSPIDGADQLIAADSPLGVLPDMSLGAHYYTDKYFVSFSIPAFLTHTHEDGKFKVKNDFRNYNYLLGGGYLFSFNNGIKLKPSLLLKVSADTRPQLDINAFAVLNKTIDVGLTYRTEEAIIGMLKVNVNNQFSFMYSYGFPISPLARYTFGSHEISLKYNFLYKSKLTGPRYLGW